MAKRILDPEAKRTALLDAAASEIAEKGFYGAHTASIADRANVGVGTLFRLFEHKEGLANQVYQRALDRYEMRLIPALVVPIQGRKEFAALWRAMIAMSTSCPADYAVIESQTHAFYLDEVSEAFRQKARRRQRDWIVAGQAADVLAPGPWQLPRIIVVGALGTLINESTETQLPIHNEVVDRLEEQLWLAIRHPLAAVS